MNDALSKLELLTPSQREFLRMTGEGKSVKEIAFAKRLSGKTVESHRAAVMNRLGIDSSFELARVAIMVQLAEMESRVAA